MAVLFNNRHEKFARLIVQGVSHIEAYKQAGFKTKSDAVAAAAASRLLRDEQVQGRIEELKTGAAKRSEISRARIHEMLLEDRDFARTCKNPAASIRAAELLGKDIGMFVDRKEIKQTVLDEMSDEQLARIEDELIRAGTRAIIEGRTEEEEGKQDPVLLPRDGSS